MKMVAEVAGSCPRRSSTSGMMAPNDPARFSHGLDVLVSEFVVGEVLSVDLSHVVPGQFDRFHFVFRSNDEAAVGGFALAVESVCFCHDLSSPETRRHGADDKVATDRKAASRCTDRSR